MQHMLSTPEFPGPGGDGRACMAQADAILARPGLGEASDKVNETVPSPGVSTVNLTLRGGLGPVHSPRHHLAWACSHITLQQLT
jgi:hypothetical protein